MDTETGEMIVKRVSVPLGLEELMEGLVKEVLLKKPNDIYLFAARYFTHLLSIRDKSQIPHCKSRTLRSVQTLKDKPEKVSSIRASRLSKQFSVREDPSDTPIITQKNKMYHRNELKYKRRHTGPPATLEITQKDDIRKKYARSVSIEKYKPIMESKNRNSKDKSNEPAQKISNNKNTSKAGSKLSVPIKTSNKEIADTAIKSSKTLPQKGINSDQREIPIDLIAQPNKENLYNPSSIATDADVKSISPDDETKIESNEILSEQSYDLSKADHQISTSFEDNKEVSKMDNEKADNPDLDSNHSKTIHLNELKSTKTLTDDQISEILLSSMSNDGTSTYDKKNASIEEMNTLDLKDSHVVKKETLSVVNTKETDHAEKQLSLETQIGEDKDKIILQKHTVDVISDDSLELNEDDVLNKEVEVLDSTSMSTNIEEYNKTKSKPTDMEIVSTEIIEEKKKDNNEAGMIQDKSVEKTGGVVDNGYDQKVIESRSNSRISNNTQETLNMTFNKIDSANNVSETVEISHDKIDGELRREKSEKDDGVITTESFKKDNPVVENNRNEEKNKTAAETETKEVISHFVKEPGSKNDQDAPKCATTEEVQSLQKTKFKDLDRTVANTEIMSKYHAEHNKLLTEQNESIDKKLNSNIPSEESDGMRTGEEITTLETENSTNFDQTSENANKMEIEAEFQQLVSVPTAGNGMNLANKIQNSVDGNKMMKTSENEKDDDNGTVDMSKVDDENNEPGDIPKDDVPKNKTYTIDDSKKSHSEDNAQNTLSDCNGLFTDEHLSSGNTSAREEVHGSNKDISDETKKIGEVDLTTTENGGSGTLEKKDIVKEDTVLSEGNSRNTGNKMDEMKTPKRGISTKEEDCETNFQKIGNGIERETLTANITSSQEHNSKDISETIEAANIDKSEKIIDCEVKKVGKIEDAFHENGTSNDSMRAKRDTSDEGQDSTNNVNHDCANLLDMTPANKLSKQTNVCETDDESLELKSLKNNTDGDEVNNVDILSTQNNNREANSPPGAKSDDSKETDIVDRVAKNYVNYIIDNDRIMQLHNNSSSEDIDNNVISTANEIQGHNEHEAHTISDTRQQTKEIEDKNGIQTKINSKESSSNENIIESDRKIVNKSLEVHNNQTDSNFTEVLHAQDANANKSEVDEIITKSKVGDLSSSTATNNDIKYNHDFQNNQRERDGIHKTGNIDDAYDRNYQNKDLSHLEHIKTPSFNIATLKEELKQVEPNTSQNQTEIQSDTDNKEINNNQDGKDTTSKLSTASIKDDNGKQPEKDVDNTDIPKKQFLDKDLIEATLSISETGLIVTQVKHFLNDFIKSEQQYVDKSKPTDNKETKRHSNEQIESRNNDISIDQPNNGYKTSSFNSSKLREELKKVEEESQFTNFKSSFNPFLLHKEIEEISNKETSNHQDDGKSSKYELESEKLEKTVKSVLKIQSMWRAYMVRKTLKKVNPDQDIIIKTAVNCTGNVNFSKTENKSGSNVEAENKSSYTDLGKLVEAVLRIQATWRGYEVRKNIKHVDKQTIEVTGNAIKNTDKAELSEKDKQFNETIPNNATDMRESLNNSNLDNKKLREIAAAVVKIQAMWRGYKIRKDKNKMNNLSNDLSEDPKNGANSMKISKEKLSAVESISQNKDILTSENSWSKKRASLKNPDLLSEVYAAIIIQKFWRGFKVRKASLSVNHRKKSTSISENSAGRKAPIESQTEKTAVHKPENLGSIQETKSEEKEDMIDVDKKTENLKINLDNKGRETYFSKDSTDSMKTVIHNEGHDTPNATSVLPRFHSESIDPLLDEISNYPITEEENLLDDYQNKLLDKISGKEEDNYNDLKNLEKIITPRAIDDLNLESLKTTDLTYGSVLPKGDKSESRDRKLSRSIGSKLEILEEEEGSNVEEDKNGIDHLPEKTDATSKTQDNVNNNEDIKKESIVDSNSGIAQDKSDQNREGNDKNKLQLEENERQELKKGQIISDVKMSSSGDRDKNRTNESKLTTENQQTNVSKEENSSSLKINDKSINNKMLIDTGDLDNKKTNDKPNNTVGVDIKQENKIKENLSGNNSSKEGVEKETTEYPITKTETDTKKTEDAINIVSNENNNQNHKVISNQSDSNSEPNINGKTNDSEQELDNNTKVENAIETTNRENLDLRKIDGINNKLVSNDNDTKPLEYEHGVRENKSDQILPNNSLAHTSTKGMTDATRPESENVEKNNEEIRCNTSSTKPNLDFVDIQYQNKITNDEEHSNSRDDDSKHNKDITSIPTSTEQNHEDGKIINGSLEKDIVSERKLSELKSDVNIEDDKEKTGRQMSDLELGNSMKVNIEDTAVNSLHLENNKLEIGGGSTISILSDTKLAEEKNNGDSIVDGVKPSVAPENCIAENIKPAPVQSDQQDPVSPVNKELYTFCSVPTPFSANDKVNGNYPPADVESFHKANNSGTDNTVLKNGTLVIPLPIEVQKTLKGEQKTGNSIADELKKSTSLQGVSSVLSNACMNSGNLHDTVIVPVNQHESIDIGRSQPIAVQLCQTSGQVYLIIILSLTSDNQPDAENMTSQRPPSTLDVNGVSTDADVEQKNAQNLGKVDLQQPKAENGYSADNSISQRETMDSEKRRKIDRGRNMEAEAATKIQAGYRGYRVRKQLKLKNGSSDMNTRKSSMKSKTSGSDTSKSSDLEQQSAVKIQASIRGFLVRRRQNKQSHQA